MPERTEATKVHFTSEEWEVLTKAAKRRGLTPAAYLRFAGMGEARTELGNDRNGRAA